MYKTHLLLLKSFLCNFEVSLNGVLVDSQYNDNYISTEVPINHFLMKGENTLSIRVLPLKDEEFLNPQACVISGITELEENSIDYSLSIRTKITELATLEGQGVNDERSSSVEKYQLFAINENFELPWLNEESFEISFKETAAVLDLYKKLHKSLEEKNIEGVMQLYLNKNLSCSNALNDSVKDFNLYVRDGIEDIWKDPNNKLWPIEKQKMIPHFFATNKLVSVYNELHQPILFYHNRNKNTATFIDVFIMKSKESQYVIIR